MKMFIILMLAAVTVASVCSFVSAEVVNNKGMYSTKYDNIDINSVIKNERLLNNYVGCLMDEKPCTPDGAELKKNLPDALASECASCSPAQKNIANVMYHHLIDNRPDLWSKLETKYDPSGGYRIRYLNQNQNEGNEEEIKSTTMAI
ncbi:allergen Tha p 1-like [Microplitis mediator]|uniref:allergen Tha p 1-like n=1 Tax=Microplitis mediator TaxID=375433 RepID=UPI0025526615|nr:allergen Tha p 1-like [Microplitis mediator]